jgi:hypothetical protein
MRTNTYIQALEAARSGEWDKAHQLVQNINTPDAAWIHAYLHRVDGDIGNAGYWYRRAQKPESTLSLKEEWQEIYDEVS